MMNPKIRVILIAFLALAVIAVGLGTSKPTVAGPVAQGEPTTSIPYQGRLSGDDGAPASEGAYDFIFEVYAAQSGGEPLWAETQTGVAVRDGYFSVLLGELNPLGVGAIDGGAFLAVSVRGPGDGSFAVLEPRQSLESFVVRPQEAWCAESADHDHWLDAWTGSPPPGFDLPWTGLRVYGSSMDARLLYHFENLAESWDSGVYGESSGAKGTGVRGVGSSYGVHGEGTYGVFGISEQTGGVGVYGYVEATSGTNWGVFGRSDSTAGRGVYGNATADSGTTYGVYGVSQSTDGRGVFGRNSATSGETYGVRGESSSNEGRGLFGGAYASSGTTYGVYGYSASPQGRGVYGQVGAASDTNYGVRGYSESTSGRGVYGYSNASSGGRVGVGGSVNGSGYGLYSTDSVYAGAGCVGCTMVFVARNTSPQTLRVGDVVAVSGVGAVLQGHTAPVLEARPALASDPSVLGVVYMRGELFPATGDDPQDFGDTVQPVEGDVAPGDYMLVVTSGLAQVRVAPTLAGLNPGQSLTIGESAGRATLTGGDASPNLVFARAMEAGPDENGLLWAMISVP